MNRNIYLLLAHYFLQYSSKAALYFMKVDRITHYTHLTCPPLLPEHEIGLKGGR